MANNPSTYVNNATPEVVELLKIVRWYADCGDKDDFYEGNKAIFPDCIIHSQGI